MAMNPRLLRPTSGSDSPASIPGLALWLDASASDALYTTDAGPVTAVGSPLDISGCALWLDASDASTISDTAGAVDQWNDKSGNDNHATASTTARPTTGAATQNGLNVLSFDGVANRMSIADGGVLDLPATILAVIKYPTSASADRYVIARQSSGANGGVLFRQVGTNMSIVLTDAASPFPAAFYARGTGWDVVSATAQAASLAIFDGGVAAGSDTSGSGFVNEPGYALAIGGRPDSAANYWDTDIAEIIVYNTALSASDRARVEAYLAAKWGISGVHAPAVTASDPVGYWRDRSGNGRHATQSTAASRPRVASASVNGRRVAEWHSSTSLMQIAGAGALANTMSMFAVAKRGPSNWGGGGGGGYGTILSIGSSSSGPAMRAANGVIGMLGGTNESTFAPSGGLGVTAHALFGGTLNSLASSLYVNGALVDSDAAAGSVGGASNTAIGAFSATTGGGGPLNAELAEIISYNRLLSTAERRKVEVYLARRWGITLAPQVSNAEAQDWISRVYAAGSTVSQPVANAVSAFVDGCQADGIWDAMKSVVLLAGADTLAGALAPLKGTAPTPYNFASGDYNKTSGLKGNGSSAYLDSNRAGNADPQNSSHIAVYGTTLTQSNNWIGSEGASTKNATIAWYSPYLYFNLQGPNPGNQRAVTAFVSSGFVGASRTGSTSTSARYGGANFSDATASSAPAAINHYVFAYNDDGVTTQHSGARLSFYSIGESLDLALLDARVSALMTAIGVS